MRDRLGEEQAWPLLDQQLLQPLQVRPIGKARHADNPDAGQLELAEQRIVAGIVNQDRRAGRQEIPDHQVERVIGAVRQHDLPGIGADAQVAQLAHQVVAQGPVSEAIAVAEQGAQAGAHHLVVVLVQARFRKPFHRRKAVAHRQHVRAAFQLLAHQPDNVHRAPQRAGILVLWRPGWALEHEVARAAPGFHQRAPNQDLERGNDRVLAVPVQLRQLPERGQLVAGAVSALDNLPLDGIGQRGGNRRGFGACHRLVLRRLDQTVPPNCTF